MTLTPTTPTHDDTSSAHPDSVPDRNVGPIVAGSLFVGFVVGLLLVAAPFVPAEASNVTGALLCGWALGWALLAVLSARFTNQPQRWAVAPAVFMGAGGLLLLLFGSSVQAVLNWVWPPALLILVVWMAIRSRQQLSSRSRLLLVYPVFAVLLVAAVGGAYETLSETADATAQPTPGELIDVGGHNLFLQCTGSGSPTVVLESGGGETSSAFGGIAPVVARHTQVCIYDRAGRGWSEPATTPQDAAQIATDLHTLLDRGHVPGPYVLAGHSFGGLYVLTFAATYPDEVAGMVLVDSTAPAPRSNAEPPAVEDGDYDSAGRISALISSTARLGLGRLFGATASHAQSTVEEYVRAAASAAQAAALDDFEDKPLVVMTAEVGSDATWMIAQENLVTLSPNSVHRVVDGVAHAGMVHDEQGAAATTEAILDVLSSIADDEALQ